MKLVSLDNKPSSFLALDDSGISLTSPGTVSPVSKISFTERFHRKDCTRKDVEIRKILHQFDRHGNEIKNVS